VPGQRKRLSFLPTASDRVKAKLLARILESLRRLSILDLGCESSVYALWLARRNRLVARLGGPGAEEAGERPAGRLCFCRFDPACLPFAGGSFDLVLAFDTFAKVDDDAGAVAEARRVLKPAGAVLLTVPENPQLLSDFDRQRGIRRRYGVWDVRERLMVGFEEMYLTDFGFPLMRFCAGARRLLGGSAVRKGHRFLWFWNAVSRMGFVLLHVDMLFNGLFMGTEMIGLYRRKR